MWVWGGLGVRVPACSLFHDEKIAFFDFGVRGTLKILKIFLGVQPKFLKKVGGFCLRAKAQTISRVTPCPKSTRYQPCIQAEVAPSERSGNRKVDRWVRSTLR